MGQGHRARATGHQGQVHHFGYGGCGRFRASGFFGFWSFLALGVFSVWVLQGLGGSRFSRGFGLLSLCNIDISVLEDFRVGGRRGGGR